MFVRLKHLGRKVVEREKVADFSCFVLDNIGVNHIFSWSKESHNFFICKHLVDLELLEMSVKKLFDFSEVFLLYRS